MFGNEKLDESLLFVLFMSKVIPCFIKKKLSRIDAPKLGECFPLLLCIVPEQLSVSSASVSKGLSCLFSFFFVINVLY